MEFVEKYLEKKNPEEISVWIPRGFQFEWNLQKLGMKNRKENIYFWRNFRFRILGGIPGRIPGGILFRIPAILMQFDGESVVECLEESPIKFTRNTFRYRWFQRNPVGTTMHHSPARFSSSWYISSSVTEKCTSSGLWCHYFSWICWRFAILTFRFSRNSISNYFFLGL